MLGSNPEGAEAADDRREDQKGAEQFSADLDVSISSVSEDNVRRILC
jgi:hypothetical protein